MRVGLLSLPTEVLVKIASHLSTEQWTLTAAMACKRLHALPLPYIHISPWSEVPSQEDPTWVSVTKAAYLAALRWLQRPLTSLQRLTFDIRFASCLEPQKMAHVLSGGMHCPLLKALKKARGTQCRAQRVQWMRKALGKALSKKT